MFFEYEYGEETYPVGFDVLVDANSKKLSVNGRRKRRASLAKTRGIILAGGTTNLARSLVLMSIIVALQY